MNAIGIDLGGTQIKGVLVTDTGAVLRRELQQTLDAGAGIKRWAETIRILTDELGADLPVGISAPGLASRDRRSISSMPGRLEGLEGLDWTAFLDRDSPVLVANDGHASLRGERWLGAARGLDDALMITLGTGVGGAILAGGNILHGHLGRAGHLGHNCIHLDGPPSITGMPGALETFIGNYNIAERTAGRFQTTHDLIAASNAGDAEARSVWLRSVHALACAIGSFINVLDPEAVIIGGGIARAGDALLGPLRAELARIEWRPTGFAVPIVTAVLGEWSGAIGAAQLALSPGDA